ncbi:acyl-CoA synthetase [Rhodoferax sp.]|uniref:acyl-CoA synthetase n=1 Tax=Rhodoferax sp. TaxID=50421 RepID=UPI00272F0445|nr:AMP-binding protein [Rhodoferax sp.]MDP1528017.1 AMP-binding protein [Rhodoferax sp.]MDP2033443.1 AMP-binding protein [Polaromonas sp.]MDP2439927.1 AMP-binding protein [Rhodoferax sp.]MDZ4207548.1 AMP-binding protein [Rhodoferax sp.]
MSVSQASDKVALARAGGVHAWALPPAYAGLHGGFAWQVPTYFNMAQACCARWATQPDVLQNTAIHDCQPDEASRSYCYAELQDQANRLANVLTDLGVLPGDRVAIVMPQRFETAVAYMAVLQMGAVAMPLSQLFGPEALEFRLQDSEAVVAIGDAQTLANVRAVRASCPDLRQVIGVRLDAQTRTLADKAYEPALAGASDQFDLVTTRADAPAILIYTSGTTGNPKGALIPHQALIGNLTGFLCSQNWLGFAMTAAPVDSLQQLTNPQHLPTGSEAVFWSPADWAWTGGLMDALLPSLYFGRPIVAFNGRFDPQVALELLRDFGVTHTFLFPTALKAMMKAFPGQTGQTVNAQFGLKLQAIMSAGEAVGDAVFDYCQSQLGVTVNEMFGQTEINYIVGNCAALWPPKPGSMGMGYPGHRLAVIDDAGTECAPGELGDVAVNRFDVQGQPDPIFFLGYWKNEAATQAKFTGDWCRTGDLASRDTDGYLWYQGRSDDVFKAAGYRIGPGEIENCLVKHPAVANVAVVPKPDAARGAVVKAYVVLSPDFMAARANFTGTREQFEAQLLGQLQAHVKDKLAPYEYPKEIEFLDALPMTTTGKVQRRVLRLQEEARALALKTTTTSAANT